MAISWVDASHFSRHRKVIAVVDVVESVRLVEQDAAAFARRWQGFVAFARERLAHEGGRLHRSLGDGLMLEFAEADGCLRTTQALHAWFEEANAGLAPEEQVRLRIGAHLAEFLADGVDIYGADVNVAARVATLPAGGETVITEALRERLPPAWSAHAQDLGACHLKHVRQPVRAYRIGPPAPAAALREPFLPLQPTVAVLPVAALAEPGTDAALGALLEALAEDGHVQVLSLLHSAARHGEPEAGLRFARALGARYLLRLRGPRAGDGFALQLVDTQGGHRLWGRRAAPPGAEAGARFASELASAVLRHEAGRTAGQWPAALDASALLAGGIVLLHAFRVADQQRAEALLEQLTERHPQQAAGPAWLAHAHVLRVQQGWSAERRADVWQAVHCSRRALDCAPRSALALQMDGWVQCQLAEAPALALARCMEAVEAQPRAALAWTWLGLAYALHGERERAAAAVQRGLEAAPLTPLKPLRDASAAAALVLASHWREAAALARRALQGNSQCLIAWEALVQAQWRMGRRQVARASAQQLLRRAPGYTSSDYLRRTPATTALITPLVAALRAAGLPD